jgi:hypothetical protein
MTVKGWDVVQASPPFKIGELVKVNGGHNKSQRAKVQWKYAIVVSDYYETESGLRVDIMIGERNHTISPYYLERVNND